MAGSKRKIKDTAETEEEKALEARLSGMSARQRNEYVLSRPLSSVFFSQTECLEY